MANDFKPVILAQLGEPIPASRVERDVVYDRIREQFDAMLAGSDPASERYAHALALDRAIAQIETELAAPPAAPADPVAEEPAPPPQQPSPAPQPNAPAPLDPRKLIAAAVAMLAILAGAAWYFLSPRDSQVAERPAASGPAGVNGADVALSEKARSFHEAMRNGDAGTLAFLLNSGFRPTRVELRAAMMEAKFTPQVQSATLSMADDIRDVACTFTTLYEVRKPMTRPTLFDAEDAFAVMKQIGQEPWKAICASESGKWREALAKMEQQSAQYNKPDAEKKSQAEACTKRFNADAAMERWEQAHCLACPENHSNCEAYCPQAPKAADAEEARLFSFNRGDMSMAVMIANSPGKNRAEIYCNLQYLTKATDFDLANLQRFRNLVSLFDPQ